MIKSIISLHRAATNSALLSPLKHRIRFSKNRMSTTSQHIITSIDICTRDNSIQADLERIHFKSETLTITLEAQADCCSCSYLFLPRGFNKNDYLGKVFDKLIATDGDKIEYNNYDYTDFHLIDENGNDDTNEYIQNKEYKIYFDDLTYFYILLKNYSNGYYGGWLSLSFEDTALNVLLQQNRAIISTTKLIIVVGLPASGKTTYCQQKYPEYVLYDDYLNTVYNNTLMQQLQNADSKVIINDPRLCNTKIFKQQVNNILQYIPITNIRFILFGNTPDQCILNSQLRNNKDKDIFLSEQIHTYSQNYDPSGGIFDYISYISNNSDINVKYEFVDVYKSEMPKPKRAKRSLK